MFFGEGRSTVKGVLGKREQGGTGCVSRVQLVAAVVFEGAAIAFSLKMLYGAFQVSSALREMEAMSQWWRENFSLYHWSICFVKYSEMSSLAVTGDESHYNLCITKIVGILDILYIISEH